MSIYFSPLSLRSVSVSCSGCGFVYALIEVVQEVEEKIGGNTLDSKRKPGYILDMRMRWGLIGGLLSYHGPRYGILYFFVVMIVFNSMSLFI